ncbi:MAG: TIGR02186 family protein [Phycisphaerae bacterium]|nr:TIGR02186 family protein [Phycisphaerae bacterium]
MQSRNSQWLTRSRVVALGVLGLVIVGVIVVKANAIETRVTLKERQLASASHPGKAVATSAPVVRSSHDVVTDGSKTHLEIGLSYAGERLELFGTLGETRADAVIVRIMSPVETVKLNQKGRVGPFWMSVKQHSVENVPFMYHVNASDKIDKLLTPEQRQELGIGYEALRRRLEIHTTKGQSEPQDANTVFEGMIRLKKDLGLYQINDDGRIVIKDDRLFKHVVHFPSAAKEGDYEVRTTVLRQGKVVGQAIDAIQVKKVGLEARIVHWAHEYPKFYGVVAVVIALAAGLAVGFVFKKGGHH